MHWDGVFGSTADGVKLGIADDSNDGSVLGTLLGSVNRLPIGGADGSDDGAADVDELKLGCALW